MVEDVAGDKLRPLVLCVEEIPPSEHGLGACNGLRRTPLILGGPRGVAGEPRAQRRDLLFFERRQTEGHSDPRVLFKTRAKRFRCGRALVVIALRVERHQIFA